MRSRQGPLEDAVSAQKALQGSETEMRVLLGGTKVKGIIPYEGSLISYSNQKKRKIEIVSRPDIPSNH